MCNMRRYIQRLTEGSTMHPHVLPGLPQAVRGGLRVGRRKDVLPDMPTDARDSSQGFRQPPEQFHRSAAAGSNCVSRNSMIRLVRFNV